MGKKILLLSPQNVLPATDGGKIGIYRPMKMLAEEHEVKAIIFIGEDEEVNTDDYAKINVTAIAARVNKKDSLVASLGNVTQKQPFKFAKYYKPVHKTLVAETCATWKPDIVICHHAHLAEYCVGLKSKHPSVQFILREHNVEYLLVQQFYQHQKSVLLRAFAYWQYKKTKKYEEQCWNYFNDVIFISDSDYTCFTQSNGVRGHIIYDGADVVPQKARIDSEKRNAFLFSGSLKSYQNKVNITSFIREIWLPWKEKFQNSTGFELWLTGDNDPAFVRDALELNTAQQNAHDIRVLGFVPSIEDVMSNARFFLSPTIIGAGIRIKVLQAMGMGCVILLTQKDIDISARFIDGVNVLLYNDLASFNNKFESALTRNDTLYDNIAKNAVETAVQNFTWQIFYDKLKAIFKP